MNQSKHYAIQNAYLRIQNEISETAVQCGRNPQDITLIAVTKSYPITSINTLCQLGHTTYGESRLQEALPKIEQLSNYCRWHFIGTLQKNKVSKVLPHFDLIHSVDTFELAKKISEESVRQQCETALLLQVNISGEISKKGRSAEQWLEDFEKLNLLSHIKIKGLMTMAPYTANCKEIAKVFEKLRTLKETWRFFIKNSEDFNYLSMGMSNDYKIAIEEGATHLRIGRALLHP